MKPEEIRKIVNRETEAWDTQNVALLLSVFHPDMVWVWPKTPADHDPMNWELPQGKFDQRRWTALYKNFFASFEWVHNERTIQKICISTEGDGAFAVVDIDTLWRDKSTKAEMHWNGRTCKTYSLTDAGWKMIHQAGVLQYDSI